MISSLIYRICGILGLLFIIAGVVAKRKKREDEFYVIGGILLFIYSYYLHDLIFMTLQVVFTLVAFIELLNRRPRRKRR